MATKTKKPRFTTPNGYDPAWLPVINRVLADRESDIRIDDLTHDFWTAHIGPMIDAIQDGGWPEMDGGGVLEN
jgi:hypothetical protein